LHKETNIFIDIEIDEPYSFEERKPIHFDDSDCERDKYFAESGFIVIRFTEDQIIDNTYQCYFIIKKCISKILDFVSASDFLNDNEECQS
jgi:very-short-patch-repair endonuclease